jgi:hypothetical protein
MMRVAVLEGHDEDVTNDVSRFPPSQRLYIAERLSGI